MKDSIISVTDVKRTYKTETGYIKKKRRQVDALKGITFSVEKGEIFGLLGPNGAGKTTMIKILTTMLTPTSGKVSILGFNPVTEMNSLRPHINFILGGERNLYWRLSAYDNLAYFADLYKLPRHEQKQTIDDLLELVGLTDVAHQRVETFSKGMKQRLQIARGLVNNPEILFLDEPSIGLDPVSARKLREIIQHLNGKGTTILLTTHYMFEADELCDRIAFIDKGEIVDIDSPENIKQKTDNVSIIAFTVIGVNMEKLNELSRLPNVQHVQSSKQDYLTTIKLHTRSPQSIVPLIYDTMPGFVIQDLTITKPSLEDVYVQLIGGKVL
ncbi:ABC transporter ATP-binding protein [Ornithinibacillus californiensis]|uniref:ABC transporter ATP-binding protein n=1 Tax=Ornithinibacillus californiensis TaxID=161536 RepID=UPI00064E147F|nr:ABC transporter ATP-binding protein [Ornithinibacillus californiensis]